MASDESQATCDEFGLFLSFFIKKVRIILNIPAMFGIIQTTIQNLECKIEKLKGKESAANYQ